MLEIHYTLRAASATLGFCDELGDPPVTTSFVSAGLAYAPAVQEGLVLTPGEDADFKRGDVNLDGAIDVADAILILSYLFGNTRRLDCLDAADANDDGRVDVADAMRLLSYLFGRRRPIPPPFEAPGPDPTPDALSCEVGPPS